MKSFFIIVTLSLISLSCFATTPYEELEGIYNGGTNAKWSDFPTTKEILSGSRQALQTTKGYITPTTTREKIQDGYVAAVVEVDFTLDPEQPKIPAVGPAFPAIPGSPAKTILKQFLVSTGNLEALKTLNSNVIALYLKNGHIIKYSLELDHGQAMVTQKASDSTLFTYYRIKDGVIVGKNFEVQDGAPDVITNKSYSYYWNN